LPAFHSKDGIIRDADPQQSPKRYGIQGKTHQSDGQLKNLLIDIRDGFRHFQLDNNEPVVAEKLFLN